MCRTGFSSLSLSLSLTHTHTRQGPTDSDLSTKDVANTAAVCPNWAGYKESPQLDVFVNPPCAVDNAVMTDSGYEYTIPAALMTGGGYEFTSPAVDWKGVCVGGVCVICHDGQSRCMDRSSDGGIPQVCV